MSDILIKNMDKPRSCFSDYKRCPFEVTSINSKEHYCSLTGDRVFRAKLKSTCPIVEVKLHGDLIDRDEAMAEFADRMCVDDILDGVYEPAVEVLRNAPTVLEASE